MSRFLPALALLTLGALDLVSARAAEQAQPPRAQITAFLKDTPEEFIKRFDKNKDGFLTKDELPPFLAQAFDRMDTNKDGKLDKQEVAVLLRVLRQRFARQPNNPAAGRAQVDQIVNNLLQRMDKDKDGRISKKEATGQIARLFDQFDTNKDGYLDRQELRQVAMRFLANRGGAGRAQFPNRPDFDALDLNADGRLTREELKGTKYAAVFDQIDTNKDGKIDRKEFEAYLKKTGQ
jgi:Ca2+-binding EF-hand superfamily protein